MMLLGEWGGANLLWGGIAAGSATGANKYFHRMNLIWGGVNFTFGTINFLFANGADNPDFLYSLKKQIAIEKIYLFNTGLDVAYIIGGLYLRERANNNVTKYDRYLGYGKSFILQGSALFLFDGIMYLVHQNHGKDLYKISGNINIGATLSGISCIVKF